MSTLRRPDKAAANVTAMTYKPLPDGLTIRPTKLIEPDCCPVCNYNQHTKQSCSACEGLGYIPALGLFTYQQIAAGVDLGRARLEYRTADTRTAHTRDPLSQYINHSYTPNCELRSQWIGSTAEPGDMYHMTLWTLTRIEPGEELTIQYSLTEYEGVGWLS